MKPLLTTLVALTLTLTLALPCSTHAQDISVQLGGQPASDFRIITNRIYISAADLALHLGITEDL